MYDPSLGRFLARDPQPRQGTANLYEYVAANPGLSTDPSGMARECGQWDVRFDHVVNGEYNWTSENAPAGVDVTVKFTADPGCCCCTQMEIVQMIQIKEYSFWGGWKPMTDPERVGRYNAAIHFDANGWLVDTDRFWPWYRGGDTRIRGCAVQITDKPRRVRFPARVEFRDYAICTSGRDKDALYGETGWGFWVNGSGEVNAFYTTFVLQNGEHSGNNEPEPEAFNSNATVQAWNNSEGNKIPTVKPCCENRR
jgi:hypothetical protein